LQGRDLSMFLPRDDPSQPRVGRLLAEARRRASERMSSSIKFSFTGAQVGCTIKQSAPRTLSSTFTCISPSEKRVICALQRSTLRFFTIDSASSLLAFPVMTLSCIVTPYCQLPVTRNQLPVRSSAFTGHGYRVTGYVFLFKLTCLARAIASAFAGTSSVIVDPAPTSASDPIFTGATKLTFEPIKALSPIVVLCFLTPS